MSVSCRVGELTLTYEPLLLPSVKLHIWPKKEKNTKKKISLKSWRPPVRRGSRRVHTHTHTHQAEFGLTDEPAETSEVSTFLKAVIELCQGDDATSQL